MTLPPHPFAELVGFSVDNSQTPGRSVLSLEVAPQHLNPHRVVHGAVLYALADTGMGAALYTTLAPSESCAAIEVKISYFKPVRSGRLVCETELVHRGRTVAHLDSRLAVDGRLVARANGHYAIFERRPDA